MSAAVQVMVAEMQVPNLTFKRVDTLVLEQLSPGMLRLNPFGELPVLVHKGRAIYGPHIIVEFLIDEYPDNPVAQKLLVPLSSSSLSHSKTSALAHTDPQNTHLVLSTVALSRYS